MTLTVNELYNVLGVPKIEELSRGFYTRVWADDEDPEFRDMFRNSNTLDGATFLLISYLVQKTGGPRLYGGMQFDTQYVKDIHKHFPITEKGARRWVYHFHETLKSMEIDRKDEVIEAFLNWTNQFAKSVINTR